MKGKKAKESALDLARRLLSQTRLLKPDPDLLRYSLHVFKDYISDCCDKSFYIEAYTLTLQYYEDLIIYSLKISKNIPSDQDNAKTVIKTLYSLGLVNTKSYELYCRVSDNRNSLVHKIIKDAKTRVKISKISPGKHKSDLLNLIERGETYFLESVKSNPDKFIIKGLSADALLVKRQEFLSGIVSDQVAKSLSGFPMKKSRKTLEREYYSRFEKRLTELFKT